MTHDPDCDCCKGTSGEAIRDRLDQAIATHGFAVQAVLPDARQDAPGYVYTIGLALAGKPELIFVGSSEPEAGAYVASFAHAALKTSAIPALGMHLPLTPPNGFAVPVWIIPADEKLTTHAFGIAATLRRMGKPEAATLHQVVMPDMRSRFPWEPGYDWLEQQVDRPPLHGTA